MGSGEAVGRQEGTCPGCDKTRRDYEERKRWFPFLPWVCLQQQSHRNQLLHPRLSWLQDTLPVESSLPESSDKYRDG